jgi:uncharacterized membrane protein YeaQ/YmgE (transglycosylase-associated protein family)
LDSLATKDKRAFIGQAVGWYRPDQGAGFIAATLGAIIVLLIWNWIAASHRTL